MLSANKLMARNQKVMHSTCLLPPELRINDKIIDVIVDSGASSNIMS